MEDTQLKKRLEEILTATNIRADDYISKAESMETSENQVDYYLGHAVGARSVRDMIFEKFGHLWPDDE